MLMFPLLFAQADLSQNAPAAPATAPPVTLSPADQALFDATKIKLKALENFKSLNFDRIEQSDWMYIGTYYGSRILFVILLMTLAWTLSSWVSSIVRAAMTRVKFDETLTLFMARFVRWLILLLAGLMCLSYFGVETTSFAALIGAAGLAIGLAFQGTLSNFAAGSMLLIFRPYKVGDTVNVANYLGKVAEIELFTTAIDTSDNRRIIVPNSSIFGAVIENITYHPVRRADVNVGTAYAADIDQTRAILDKAVRSVALVVPAPPPEIVLTDLGASSVNWQVRGWAKRDTFGDAKQAIIRAVKIGLDEARISIPFPQLDLHLDPPGPEPNSTPAPPPEPVRWAPKISNT
jgi:small conductance mechanosensitive channel